MFNDCRGLALTTVSEQAATTFDAAVDGYLGYRADMASRAQPDHRPNHGARVDLAVDADNCTAIDSSGDMDTRLSDYTGIEHEARQREHQTWIPSQQQPGSIARMF